LGWSPRKEQRGGSVFENNYGAELMAFNYDAAVAHAMAEIDAAYKRAGRTLSESARADLRNSCRVAGTFGATEWDVMLERALSAAGIGFHWEVLMPPKGKGEFKPGKGFLVLDS
jgi:hypothetical protein